jgi:hypothetical protein
MSAILNEHPTDISQLVPSAPPALQRVVHRCLEYNPTGPCNAKVGWEAGQRLCKTAVCSEKWNRIHRSNYNLLKLGIRAKCLVHSHLPLTPSNALF